MDWGDEPNGMGMPFYSPQLTRWRFSVARRS